MTFLLLSPRDRPSRQAHHNDQRRRAAVPSRLWSWLLPRPAGLELPAAIIGRGVRRYLPAPSRKKRFLPFHLIFPLWLRRSLAWGGDHNGTTQLSYPQINHPKAPLGLNREIWLALSRPNVCCRCANGCDSLVEKSPILEWAYKGMLLTHV